MAVHTTRGLLVALLEMAADGDPESVTVALGATPVGEFGRDQPSDLDPETRVFTHLYPPDLGASVTAVFGMDLATPAGRTHGRFISHPDGRLAVSVTDDLHGTVLVAVPPYDLDAVAAFDRQGRRLELVVVDAEPDVESVPS